MAQIRSHRCVRSSRHCLVAVLKASVNPASGVIDDERRTNMKYATPEVKVLGKATDVVANHVKRLEISDGTPPPSVPDAAYDLDE